MSYDFYQIVFIVALVLSVIMLAVTVWLFFALKIRTAIGDLTGSSKRKAIENLQNKSNASQTDKRINHKVNSVDNAAGDLAQESVKTSKISPQDRYDTLEAPETSLLEISPVFETSVLNSPAEYFEKTAECNSVTGFDSDSGFSIESEITFVHSNEVIK